MLTTLQFAEGDFAKQAQLTAAQLAKQAQLAGKNAQEGFNRFVEGGEHQRRDVPIDESKKDFWDSFSNLADEKPQNNSSIGTSAMGKGRSGSGAPAAPAKKADDWDDW